MTSANQSTPGTLDASWTPSPFGEKESLHRKAHGLLRSVFIYISSDSCVHSSC